LATLRAQYPRNRLLWLESGATLLRGGKPAEAEQVLNEGLARLAADDRPRLATQLMRNRTCGKPSHSTEGSGFTDGRIWRLASSCCKPVSARQRFLSFAGRSLSARRTATPLP